ncbi:cell division protein ZapE [Candidatus Chlorohelix allophototropha]|uniref:Cell division protein ZapE n=1 Tax=Candidatus Chlorohelix allophototropha TaxID=3003348 RepID=A0ABY9AZR4_9CHLR|nr:cell division protein ZapE [Chloroflexota bacterium L227-S17]
MQKSQDGLELPNRTLTFDQIDCEVSIEEVVGGFVPTPRFSHVSFESYRPDPKQPSQASTLQRLREYVSGIQAERGERGGLLGFLKKKTPVAIKGLYLDGGYGVGKTHLLASAYLEAPAPKAYLSFQELAYAIGAKGMAPAIEAFKPYRLICVDEFELDDVGNTMLAKTFIRGVMEGGNTHILTTSNTLPSELGQGRFNADDFKREIGIIAQSFESIRLEGEDYRHRAYGENVLSEGIYASDSAALHNAYTHYMPLKSSKLYTTFDELLKHLAAHHPIRYSRLLVPLEVVFIEGLAPFHEQIDALRFVHFIDKLYDQRVKLAVSARCTLPDLFLPEYRDKGYAKKYRRCLSRLHELISEGI